MANWEEIRTNVEKTACKAAKKTEELAKSTAKYVKLKSFDSKISSKYEELGRLTYKQIKDEISQADKIAKVMGEIDGLIAKRNALKEEIDAEKERRKAEKEESKKAE